MYLGFRMFSLLYFGCLGAHTGIAKTKKKKNKKKKKFILKFKSCMKQSRGFSDRLSGKNKYLYLALCMHTPCSHTRRKEKR